MGIAALILGILSILLSFIPGCGLIMVFLPALIGLILGIVDVVKKSKSGGKKGLGIAGIILNVLAIIISIVSTVLGGALSGAALEEEMSSYDYYDYDYDF